MQTIEDSLSPLRKSQADATQGFAKLAQRALVEVTISANHQEPIALSNGININARNFFVRREGTVELGNRVRCFIESLSPDVPHQGI
jgi:hypothetical protein